MGQFDFHYATVIMVAGSDRITLENSGGDKGARDQKWKIETYGPASKNQSFHEEWAKTGRGTPGPAGTAQATTLVPWPPLLCTKLICSMSGSPFSNSAFALPGRRHCGVAAMAAPARRAAAGSRGRPQAEREPERSGGSQRPLDAVKGRRHLHFRFRP
jgi:hypothetical protein